MQTLVTELRSIFNEKQLTIEEFSQILDEFARLDQRCILEQKIKEGLYAMLQEKQQAVLYSQVEILVFEFLLQQSIPDPEIDVTNLGPLASKVPLDMLKSITPEFIVQFTNFYKLCSNKFKPRTEFKKLETFALDLQRTTKIDPTEIIRYLQVLKDETAFVLIKEILGLINELQKLHINTGRASLPSVKAPITHQQIDTTQDEEIPVAKLEYSNIVYQQIDLLKQDKNIQKSKDLNAMLNEIVKIVQHMDIALQTGQFQHIELSKENEELKIEKELMSNQLDSLESELKRNTLQIGKMLDDNDYALECLQQKSQECDQLQSALTQMVEESKSMTKLESELRILQIEIERLQGVEQRLLKEQQRLQGNNRELVVMLNEMEQQGQTQVTITKPENHDECVAQINELHEQIAKQEIKSEQSELLIIDLRRELVHYKQMYQYQQNDNMQLRSSIMPSNNRLSAIRQNKQSVLGRPSQFPLQRISYLPNNRLSQFPSNRLSAFPNRITNIGRISGVGQLSSIKPMDQEHRINIKQVESIIPDEDQVNNVTFQQPKDNNIVNAFAKLFDQIQEENENEQMQSEYITDDTTYYSRDFLGIRDLPLCKEKLEVEKKIYKPIIQKCFSDQIYRIDCKGSKARRIIFVTEYNFYVFEGEKKPKSLSRSFKLEQILSLVFSETSPILCCIKILDQDDYLIETFKRSELNSFLTEVFGHRKLLLFQLDFKLSFQIKFKGKKELTSIEDLQKHGYLDGGKQSPFKVSQLKGNESAKVGWLQMYNKKLLFKDWQEVFILLTNVGLIIFKKPGEMTPLLFVSIVEAMVVKNPIGSEVHKEFMFKIRYEVSNMEFLFATRSQAQLDEWHDLIQKAVMEQFKLQTKYLEDQQGRVTMERTETLKKQYDNS